MKSGRKPPQKPRAEMWSRLSDEEKQLREINRMNTRDNWTEEERKCYSEKMSESAKRDRATRTPEEYKLSADKGFETRRKRKNFNTSSYEQELYKVLVERFGVQDICAEYKEDRYPFHCDFYIKSLDLFIELNLHWTHGKHPFNSNNPEDLVELERIHSKQCLTPDGKENSFFVYEKVWTGYDVQKLKLAKQNKLNYILIYSKEEFSNLKQQIIEGSVLL